MRKSVWLASVFALSLTAAACGQEPVQSAGTESGAIAAAGASSASTAVANVAQEPQVAANSASQQTYVFPDDAWRSIDPENTLYIETEHGMIVLELAPEFAPNHVDRMKTLAREHFYDYLVFHRVIDGFMAQGGGSRANPAHSTELPNLNAEFSIRRGPDMPISELQQRAVNPRQDTRQAPAGFWNGFAAGTAPIAQSAITGDGRVESWLLHCAGAASMARTSDPNSAGSQFYITRGNADHLNTQYTVWGRVRYGQNAVDQIAVGTMGENFGFTPDTIQSMRVGSDLDDADRLNLEVVDTNSAAFTAYLDTLRNAAGQLPDVCDIPVPTRLTE